jgi:UDP-3-O-[3-hydroxymyristoyl] glucosamine N-acyltransferase
VIGENCLIHANVAIYNTIIGNNVIIHAEQFLALMRFIKKSETTDSTIAFRRRVVIKDNVVLEHFVQ